MLIIYVFFFVFLFAFFLERRMAEIEGPGGSTRTNEARCHGGGSHRALECARRSSASIAGNFSKKFVSSLYFKIYY